MSRVTHSEPGLPMLLFKALTSLEQLNSRTARQFEHEAWQVKPGGFEDTC